MSKKAAVFCPNPGVDRMYHLQSPLAAGQLFRTERAEIFPGSKGANVALALAGKGVPVTVFTFTGGRAGALSESLLTDRGVTVIGVPTACGVRENTKVVEPGGRSTEFNENGGPVSAGEAAALLSLAGNGTYDALFLCGSLPRGVAEDYYAAAIAAAKARGALTFLDTSGAALTKGAAAKPDFIKPNAGELAALTGEREPQTLSAAAVLAEKWQKEHPETGVICTAGKAGAVYVGKEGTFVQEALPVPEIHTTVGAGDNFLAGFAAAILQGAAPEEALTLAAETAARYISE